MKNKFGVNVCGRESNIEMIIQERKKKTVVESWRLWLLAKLAKDTQ